MKISNKLGLTFDFLENGAVQSIFATPIRISLKAGTPWAVPGTNIYVRERSLPYEFSPLLSPVSNCYFGINSEKYIAKGNWKGLEFSCLLTLSGSSLSWKWSIEITNKTGAEQEIDLFYVQDVGLKPVNSGLVNEYYVSQYLERIILNHDQAGKVICCRQNMKESTGYPWLLIASQEGAAAACTDGIQFYGKTFRATGVPEGLLTEQLGGNCAGESSVVALQSKVIKLQAEATCSYSFSGTYMQDHPAATGNADLERLPALWAEFESIADSSIVPEKLSVSEMIGSALLLQADELSEKDLIQYFGPERRHEEFKDDKLLSFFTGVNNHVVLREKEILADRPHAHIMQANTRFVPGENIMSSTAFAFGVFNSHISQGNTNFNVLLSVCTSQFNLSAESGQRILVELNGKFFRLGVPSAFEMGLQHCRWIYKTESHCFEVHSWTSVSESRVNLYFKVLKGSPVRMLITHNFDPLNQWKIEKGQTKNEYVAIPRPGSMITEKFVEAQFRMLINSDAGEFEVLKEPTGQLFVLEVNKTESFGMSFVGEVCQKTGLQPYANAAEKCMLDQREAQKLWQSLSLNLKLGGEHRDMLAINEILPWYGMNALIHYLTPYGLEQFSGAAWGTRDVSQGPVELLLTMEKYREARQVLCTIFANQNTDGGWPQWWMFDSYQYIRAGDSHGDVFYWVIIALSNYVKMTGDLSILDEKLPYFSLKADDVPEISPVSAHIEKLIGMITDSFITGTSLVPFGGGDWNDSLQPVSEELANRMISSWTVEMNYQAFLEYVEVFKLSGNDQKANELQAICENIKADFNKFLVKDGIVAGYGLVENDGDISVLLHPSDKVTGIRYSLLPMERGIVSGIFTKEQAHTHLELIEKHLKGRDGARLMDSPLKYKGGVQTIFQRAESSTFFGREIGLMYVHEHIRYAEAQARVGRAGALVKALRQAIPVSYRQVVDCSDIRQANCYYSSSDVTFGTRYEADEKYSEVLKGNMTLRGGWRVYSSGPGIFMGIIVSRLMGIRIESSKVVIDPVLPVEFDGCSLSLDVRGRNVLFRFAIKKGTFSPKRIVLNGKPLELKHEFNPYRAGGAEIPAEVFFSLLNKTQNTVEVEL